MDGVNAGKKSVELNPNDPDNHYALAVVYVKGLKNELAIEELKEALKIRPSHQEARRLLSNLESKFSFDSVKKIFQKKRKSD